MKNPVSKTILFFTGRTRGQEKRLANKVGGKTLTFLLFSLA
jgi:hypothetical protein